MYNMNWSERRDILDLTLSSILTSQIPAFWSIFANGNYVDAMLFRATPLHCIDL